MHKRTAAYKFGIAAEKAVAELLRQRGRSVVVGGGNLPYDLIVDGWRVDVKASNPCWYAKGSKQPTWFFAIAHCWVGRQEMDFYVFRMEQFPAPGLVGHALFKAPIKVSKIAISALSGPSSQPVKDFVLFAKGKYGKGTYIEP